VQATHVPPPSGVRPGVRLTSPPGDKLPAMLGLAARTRAVNRRLKSLVALNIELAKLEGKQKATALGMAAGFAVGAAALVFYAIGFGFAAAAA
jgi:hypothetical protein